VEAKFEVKSETCSYLQVTCLRDSFICVDGKWFFLPGANNRGDLPALDIH